MKKKKGWKRMFPVRLALFENAVGRTRFRRFCRNEPGGGWNTKIQFTPPVVVKMAVLDVYPSIDFLWLRIFTIGSRCWLAGFGSSVLVGVPLVKRCLLQFTILCLLRERTPEATKMQQNILYFCIIYSIFEQK